MSEQTTSEKKSFSPPRSPDFPPPRSPARSPDFPPPPPDSWSPVYAPTSPYRIHGLSVPQISVTKMNHSYINTKYSFYGIEQQVDNHTFLPVLLTGSDLDVSLGNALRRVFSSEIPCYGLSQDNMKITHNSSQYHREVLLERFQFITLNNEVKALDRLQFYLADPKDVTKPLENTSIQIMKIYLHDHVVIKSIDDDKVIPVREICPYNSLLMTLNPGEKIHVLLGIPVLGTGRQHPMWQTSLTMMKYATKSDIGENLTLPEITNHRPATLDNNVDQMSYLGYEKKNPEAIILTVESMGKYRSNTVVKRGFEVLMERLLNLRQQILNHVERGRSESVAIEEDQTIRNMIRLRIINEDHTIGHLLESYILRALRQIARAESVETDKPELEILTNSLSAYRKIHPLENHVDLLVKFPLEAFDIAEYGDVEHPAIRLILIVITHLVQMLQNHSMQLGENFGLSK